MAVSAGLVFALLLCGVLAAPPPPSFLPRALQPQVDPVRKPSESPLCNPELGAFCQGSPPAPRVDIDTSALVEQLRTIILEGDVENGIPVLDPFVLEGPYDADVELGFNNWAAQASVEHVVADGLAAVDLKLSVNTVGLTRLAIEADVTIPELTVSGNYNFTAADGDGGNLFGKGPLSITLNDVELDVTLTFTLVTLKFQSLAVDINLDNIGVTIKGLIHGGVIDGIASMALSELANELFKEQEGNIEKALVDSLSPVIEEYLDNTSLADVICPIVSIPFVC